MAGRVVHFELPYEDADRAGKFYADLFGWQVMPMPEMDYSMVMTGPSTQESGPSEPGFINGGMFSRSEPGRGGNIVIDVDDIDATLTAVEQAGGKTVVGRQPVGDMGFTGYFTDCEGNLVGLWQNA
ncbi:VOC family protein [Nocardioides sp. CER19]|uniref:VOC family protein n=1 Tax=Nocardioides sp. CER19 TaxID=3038538 RepID=UPI00244B6B78|nr:VOC family protein [Nocardioides sp. CER19]MDH2415181.1 VOC family protein [Nocardioides sp. CER19]